MRRVRAQDLFYTLSLLYSANGSLMACTLGSFDHTQMPDVFESTNEQPSPGPFELKATGLLENFIDTATRTQKIPQAVASQLLCTAEHILQQAGNDAPHILSCTEGIKFEPQQPRNRHAQFRGRLKNNEKPQSASTTPSSDLLHDLWLEAAENTLRVNEQDNQTTSPTNQPGPSPEELATKTLIQNSVALLILKKNEIESLGAGSFERKKELRITRTQIKNKLLVYFMSIDRLGPCTKIPHLPAYSYREPAHPYTSAHSSMTEHNRPASPTPENRSRETRQDASTSKSTTSQLKRSESSKSLSDHNKSNACFGDN